MNYSSKSATDKYYMSLINLFFLVNMIKKNVLFIFASSYFSIADLERYNTNDDDENAMILKQHIMDTVDLIQSTTNNDYVLKIRSRMQEDTQARKEREKRRRKVLVDQLKATESLEVKSNLLIKNFFNIVFKF